MDTKVPNTSATGRKFVYKYNGRYIIYDRFFAIWLRNI